MTARSHLDPDNTTSLTCELCSKSHERRDLLMRHRRRCQGPKKSINRRKACNECVQAKTKCDYTQPTCSRCTRRGTQCVYAASSVVPTRDQPEQPNEALSMHRPQSTLQPSFDQNGNLTAMTEPYDLELPAWDSSASPFSLEIFNMADLANPAVTLPGFTNAQSAMVQAAADFTSSSQTLGANSLTHDPGLLSFSSTSWGISTPTLDAPPSSETASSVATPPSSSTSDAPVRLLSEYPSFLMKDGSSSPFLHLSLYSDIVPDITVLPFTSMAICCGSGINLSDRSRFFRRAIDAERQRLIKVFPSYECMEQWDALHAMLIYEDLELRETVWDEVESWKHDPRVRGLRSPFILKMTQSYLRSYPEICNHDINVFSDPRSVPNSSTPSTWARWAKTETARRMVFLANMLNFYSNRDYSTGKQLPYYEPLNDDLILNMPLPCSQVEWLARNEDDWRSAMQNAPSSLIAHGSSGVDSTRITAFSSETSLKTIFSKFTKDHIQVEFGRSFGFGDSDALKALIVLCASEQFT